MNALPSTMTCSWLSTTSISASGKLLLKKWKNLFSDLNTLRTPTTLVELSHPPVLVWSSLPSKMVLTFGILLINLISLVNLSASPLPSPSSNSSSLSRELKELNSWPTVMTWVSWPSVKSPWPWESAKKMKKSLLQHSGTVKSRSVNSYNRGEWKCALLTTPRLRSKKLEKPRKTRCARPWIVQRLNAKCWKRKPTKTTYLAWSASWASSLKRS